MNLLVRETNFIRKTNILLLVLALALATLAAVRYFNLV